MGRKRGAFLTIYLHNLCAVQPFFSVLVMVFFVYAVEIRLL